jgi:hypothetical protein
MSGYQSAWTPESDADLIRRRDGLHQKWNDIAFIMGKSRRNVERRHRQIVEPVRKPRGIPLHQELGILTHIHRQAILVDTRNGMWDELAQVWSHSHLYRESITLAGAC